MSVTVEDVAALLRYVGFRPGSGDVRIDDPDGVYYNLPTGEDLDALQLIVVGFAAEPQTYADRLDGIFRVKEFGPLAAPPGFENDDRYLRGFLNIILEPATGGVQ